MKTDNKGRRVNKKEGFDPGQKPPESRAETPDTETDNRGTWFNKKDRFDFVNIFDPEREPPEGYTKTPPLDNEPRQHYDETARQWVKDVADETKLNARREIAAVKQEIAERDYRALKAFRLGVTVDELYPGETAWYRERVARIHELEGRV